MLKEIIEILFHIIMYQTWKIKDFNVLPVKSKEEAYDKIIEISRNND